MDRLKTNLLFDFSVACFLIMVALAVAVSVILSTRLNRNVELLEDHGAAMMAGIMIKEEDSFSIPSLKRDVVELRWITIGTVGAAFVMLYGALVLIVWRGSRTIRQQQLVIEEHTRQQVEALNRLLQDRINVLFDEVMRALSVARANPAFAISAEYHELVEELSALVGPEQNGVT